MRRSSQVFDVLDRVVHLAIVPRRASAAAVPAPHLLVGFRRPLHLRHNALPHGGYLLAGEPLAELLGLRLPCANAVAAHEDHERALPRLEARNAAVARRGASHGRGGVLGLQALRHLRVEAEEGRHAEAALACSAEAGGAGRRRPCIEEHLQGGGRLCGPRCGGVREGASKTIETQGSAGRRLRQVLRHLRRPRQRLHGGVDHQLRRTPPRLHGRVQVRGGLPRLREQRLAQCELEAALQLPAPRLGLPRQAEGLAQLAVQAGLALGPRAALEQHLHVCEQRRCRYRRVLHGGPVAECNRGGVVQPLQRFGVSA
mmetsp:Transcript_42833/g.121054  ORF Transcript_42833/g.121054 Transcript_42833/m.121054 type:complete len:314 (+) Transcript_42833:187-1128(+)